MIGVYSPSSHTAIYGKGYGKIGIHFKSSGLSCIGDFSSQEFAVINKDSGRVVGTFSWYKPVAADPRIDIIEINNPGGFMEDVTGHKTDAQGELNLRCGHP